LCCSFTRIPACPLKEPLWIDLYILAEQLTLGDIELIDIPTMRNIAAQSAASMFMHGLD